MIFLDRQKMFGAVKISCSPLTFVLAFFQMQKDKIQGKIHPPIPSEEVPPSRKLDISRQGVTRVAFSNGRGVAACPTTMASASECG
ncbi:uncharacterized protein LOC143694192 isoform X2 [Agelaius phoeniceus]|uniref:uncharacterized protein LOC143694192 isoform X2 n=1 Tax=Agelaius phoeniceus TaxID=39638 RepID=UPI004054A12E